MKYFCILLQSEKKRVEHVTNHLLKIIPSLEIISAIDAKTSELEYKFGKREIDMNFLKFCRRGQIACLLSHVEIWKRMVNENIKESIIFEDDAVVTDIFHKHIENILKSNADFIYLFVHPDSRKNRRDSFNDFLDKGYSTYGTVSYYITLDLAKELIVFFEKKIFTTIDDSLSWYLETYKKKYYCVAQNLVETYGNLYFQQGNSILGSTINNAGLFKDSFSN